MSSYSTAGGGEGSGEGSGSFQVHPGHSFGGLLLTGKHERTAVALCGCGAVLSRAKAVFTTCSECSGTGDRRADVQCLRCGGTGEVVDHAALEWRRADDETEEATW
ncbi:MAG: hypothetical protein ACRDJT_07685 [Actinomycetota bacterium]